jgi:hypothetical protein
MSMVLMFLALTDIWHGESDVTLEWRIVAVGFWLVVAFHFSAAVTLWLALTGDRCRKEAKTI